MHGCGALAWSIAVPATQRLDADRSPRTYLLTNYSGPWESWGLVAIIDPTRAQVVSN
jgi:hypothetical protein